jgi:hypothetical protein
MQLHLTLDCRICKKKKSHVIIPEFDQLPPNTYCVQCSGCGVMGVQLVKVEDESL